MNQIQWSAQFAVGIEKMDEQHQSLFALTDALQESLGKNWNSEKTREMFDLLIDHVVRHFLDEEAFMTQHNYPAKESHKALHEELIKQVEYLENEWNRGRVVFSPDLAAFIQKWLTEHISGPDRELAKFLKDKGQC